MVVSFEATRDAQSTPDASEGFRVDGLSYEECYTHNKSNEPNHNI